MFHRLTDSVLASPQISIADLSEAKALGVSLVINNRPDGEEQGQPDSAEIAAAAEELGLEYHYLPVNGLNFPGDHLQQMADLFDDVDRPAFAFCRTGTRCSNLWVLSRDPEERERAAQLASKIGFDLSMVARVLG